jgi:hypothetical protein
MDTVNGREHQEERDHIGLIRKAAFLGTGGIVAPRSKKERDQIRLIGAMQGKSATEIRRAGGRYDFEGFWARGGVTEPKSRPLPEPFSMSAPPPVSLSAPPLPQTSPC